MFKELIQSLIQSCAFLITALFALFLAFVITCVGAGGVLGSYAIAKEIFPEPDAFIYSTSLNALVFLFFILYFIITCYKLITSLCPLVYKSLKKDN